MNKSNLCFASTLNESSEPTCYIDALNDSNLVDAINNEIGSLSRNNTWTICDLPVGRKLIRYVNNAFLYGDLYEYVYTTLPQGYGNIKKGKVRKLNKPLYGLKQAPRQWNAKLTTALVEHDFKQSKFYYSLYIKKSGDVFVALLVLLAAKHVDIALPDNTHMHNPLQSHIKVALRVLRKLGMVDMFASESSGKVAVIVNHTFSLKEGVQD
ncbi:ribonuclease H-like domain-containing protein [Tanacetum coccineum]